MQSKVVSLLLLQFFRWHCEILMQECNQIIVKLKWNLCAQMINEWVRREKQTLRWVNHVKSKDVCDVRARIKFQLWKQFDWLFWREHLRFYCDERKHSNCFLKVGSFLFKEADLYFLGPFLLCLHSKDQNLKHEYWDIFDQ